LLKNNWRIDLITNEGQKIHYEGSSVKYAPSISEMERWINECGFDIVKSFGNRNGIPMNENTSRAIYWAQKRQ
jgi:hypothetical protein